MAWRASEYGRPTAANLAKWAAKYNESLAPGGCNAHLGRAGCPPASRAEITENRPDGRVVAEWAAPPVRVFVYGSLMRGFHNHRLLADATFVGENRTVPGFAMWSMGAYPAVTRNPGGTAVPGEVYEVDAETLTALDQLEGHPVHYRRESVRLADGTEAWVYLYPAPPDRASVPGNDWRAFRAKGGF